MIEVKGLTHGFGEGKNYFKILDDISLEINKGDFVAIIGHSGSGKTTLLNILSGIMNPASGTVKYEGQEINDFSKDEQSRFRKEKIGFVFQDFKLIPYYSVIDNVIIPYIHDKKRPELIEEAKAKLAMVGIKERSYNNIPKKLSGGEKQRVAIARALMGDPKVLICDEPTGNLDVNNRDLIMEVLTQLKNNGQTIILVTHDLELTKYCNRVLSLKEGRLTSI
jgi:ABC-type lipoprotein export system ATPase subunit